MYAARGIIAGDRLSGTLVKVYYLETFDAFREARPLVHLDVYVGDILLTAGGKPHEVRSVLEMVTKDLKRRLDPLDCALALDEATATASSSQLANDIRSDLGGLGGEPALASQLLGVDQLRGRRRCILTRTSSKIKKRASAAFGRRVRLRRRMVKANSAVRIFTTGHLPAATYGVEVQGASNTEIKKRHRTAASARTPGGKGAHSLP